ncbi:hypothetical protein BKA70DRAFT_1428629 [Coprinopsis sp. MPI-PUGE-AT-0042]|nr:hypothetical protein BKA70DRAFT_1428629 [Coprinopsis sp. MPI-PUGE-AT-0042]
MGTQYDSGRAARETGLLSLQASIGKSTSALLVSAGVTDISRPLMPTPRLRPLAEAASACFHPSVPLKTHTLSFIDILGARGQWFITLKGVPESSLRSCKTRAP